MIFSAGAIAKILLTVGAEIGTTFAAAAMRAFSAKFAIRLIIKLMNSIVKRSKTRIDDTLWPPFRDALEKEIGGK